MQKINWKWDLVKCIINIEKINQCLSDGRLIMWPSYTYAILFIFHESKSTIFLFKTLSNLDIFAYFIDFILSSNCTI